MAREGKSFLTYAAWEAIKSLPFLNAINFSVEEMSENLSIFFFDFSSVGTRLRSFVACNFLQMGLCGVWTAVNLEGMQKFIAHRC